MTSATVPAWLTMNTFIPCDTCRPVNTAVFITSQFYRRERTRIKLADRPSLKTVLKRS